MPALISSRARVALISSGSIFDIEERALELYKNNKIVFVHIDLIDGLGRDEAAVKFLKEKAAVDGIVTPNRHLVAVARKQGIIAVHRLFVHDSPSIETGIKVLQMSNPDFIEVLPGLMVSKVISTLRKHFKQPVIGAGLVKTPEEVKLLLDAGAVGVDTSARNLWNL
jgi:glycerol uptake operon antiterminator